MYTTRLAPRRHSIVDTKTPHYYVFDLSNVASCIGVLILGLSRLVLWDNTIAMITWTNSRSRNSNKCNFHYVCAPGCAWLFILNFRLNQSSIQATQRHTHPVIYLPMVALAAVLCWRQRDRLTPGPIARHRALAPSPRSSSPIIRHGGWRHLIVFFDSE